MSLRSEDVPGAIPYMTSSRTLLKASAGAFTAAVVILTLIVLPAERGIDPTGIGAALGLTRMARADDRAPASTSARSAADAPISTPVRETIIQRTPMREDEMTIVVKPHSGVEVKASMKTGDHLVFRWQASAPVKMDMHGERPDAGDAFTRYWMENDMTSAQGALTAPFDGRHGWYFRNRGETDVTIKVRTAGFYESLFQPG